MNDAPLTFRKVLAVVAVCAFTLAAGCTAQYVHDRQGYFADLATTAAALALTDAVEAHPIIASCGPNVIATIACAGIAKIASEEAIVAVGYTREQAVHFGNKAGELAACNNVSVIAGGNIALFILCVAIMNVSEGQ